MLDSTSYAAYVKGNQLSSMCSLNNNARGSYDSNKGAPYDVLISAGKNGVKKCCHLTLSGLAPLVMKLV